MKQQLIKEVYALYKGSLNAKSKWYADDLSDFRALLQTKTVEQLKQQIANMRGIMGLDEQLNRVLSAEEKRMERAGMYDLGKMKPENALDWK